MIEREEWLLEDATVEKSLGGGLKGEVDGGQCDAWSTVLGEGKSN